MQDGKLCNFLADRFKEL